jgi:Uma2 family endonuclease
MMQGIQYPPKTIMEVFKALPEGTLAEIIEGNLIMSPGVKTSHQRIHKRLFSQLATGVEDGNFGEFWYAPHDVFLDEHSNVVQPDLYVISNEQLRFVEEDGVHCSPILIIEILSPSNRKHDIVTKKALYEKFGVKEYWIIDPKTKQSTGYLLKDGIYNLLETDFGKLKSVILNHEFAF